MAIRTSSCDPDKLKRLLDGQLADVESADVVSHIESCSDCREQMQSLAAGDGWWLDTRDALSGLDSDQPSFVADDTDGHAHDSTSVPLDFLSPSDNPAMIGRLGEFEIIEEIGCGGMGIVLKGYDHELNRYVAVKVLHPFCATSAAARRRFVREAQAAAAIVHQHVVAIHAVDANHHPPYLVMPFVPGESLQQRSQRQGPFDPLEAVRIGQQVAEGLAAAHAQGLVHRDIKPGNILLERNVDRVLLSDFGLARAADDASLTRSGVIAGTPQYMSPEQARGERIDHRTDLFSLRSVLYTMLAGHSPFRADSAMSVLRRVCDDTPRPLREINPHAPEWLERFVARLLAKNPADRIESAAKVSELLEGALAHLQQPTSVPLPAELVVPPHRIRNERRYWAYACALVVTGVIAAVWVRPGSHPSPPAPVKMPEEARVSDVVPTDWDDPNDKELNELKQSMKTWDSDGDF